MCTLVSTQSAYRSASTCVVYRSASWNLARVRVGVAVAVGERYVYLLPVLGRYHEDVALAELRPELRALDASIELVAVDRLDEQLERAHLKG